MKVTLNTQEIQEAVQCYISNILGSDLQVTEISVVQGRDSNGSRIELELSKSKPIDLGTIPVTPALVKSLNIPVVDEDAEEVLDMEPETTVEEPKAETSKPLSEPVVEQTVNASFFNRAN